MAALFKEPALTLPVILIAYDYQWKKSDKTMLAGIKRYVPYVAVSSVYLLARYYALKTFAPLDFYPDLGTYQFIINVFPLFREYLTSLLWPLHLNVWHTFQPINSLFEAKGMISFVVTVIFCIVTVAAYRRNKVFFFGLLFLVVTLLPVFYIRGISGKPFAERYLYLPSLGYALLLATFLSWAKQKLPRAVRSVPIVFIVIVCLYTIATINRNSVWKNNMNLWSDTVEKSPDSAHVRTNLGEAYAAQGLWDRAMTEYQTALRLNPDYAQAHNNLGAAYASQGLWDRAMAEHQTAVRLNPDYAQAHNNLGNAYAAQGLWDRAMAEYQTVLRLNPDYAQAHYNLGAAYASQGLLDKAMAEYQTVLRLNPDDAQAHNNLGAAYASQGLLDRAMGEFKTALRLKPDYSEAEYNLAFIYLKKGNADMALREVEVILSIRPDFSKARELRNDIISRRH
jgi:tetratricopeptide (TPR) repeat protein